MSKIIGRFYFQIDDSGNLSGTFSNNLHTTNYSEQALRISGIGFIGQFKSTWSDNLGNGEADLKISLKQNSQNIYTLLWSNESTQFFGEGILVDNTLIGDYRNFNRI